MLIRPAGPGDEPTIIGLWQRCGLLVNPLNDPAKDIVFCRESGHGEVLVHGEGSDVDGVVMVGHDGHRGWLYYLAVDPSRQGQGIGRRLLAAAEAWWRKHDVPKGELMIRDTNHRAVGFYQRCGYRVEPVITMSRRLDGTTVAAGGSIDDEPVVITYLEMTERPAVPYLAPPVRHMALLGAGGITVPFYRFLYDAVGRPWYWTDRKALTDEQLSEILAHEKVEVFVLYVDGTPAGYFELDARAASTVDLAYFGIMPEFIGRRLGPWLLLQAIEMAWAKEPARMTVNTCTLDHPAALPLYQKFGFRPYDRKEAPAPGLRATPISGLESG